MKTGARADCIALHCTSGKRHFRLLRCFACQNNILPVIIYTSRYVVAVESVGFMHLQLGRCLNVCVLSVFIISVYLYLLQF